MVCYQNIFPDYQENADCLRCKVMSDNDNGTYCVKLVDLGFTKVVDKLWPDYSNIVRNMKILSDAIDKRH